MVTETDTFKDAICARLFSCLGNNFFDNDFPGFGLDFLPTPENLREKIRRRLFDRKYVSRFWLRKACQRISDFLQSDAKVLAAIYTLLEDDASRNCLLNVLAYRLLGKRHVKMGIFDEYLAARKKNRDIPVIREKTAGVFMGKPCHLVEYDLSSFGNEISRLFTVRDGLVTTFFLEQYALHRDGIDVVAEPGDVVVDAGGCWGDTALYFANRVGPEGRVLSWEFIPGNLSILQGNLDENPLLADRITLVNRPVWREDGFRVYFEDKGPSSRVSTEPCPGFEGSVETWTIDSMVSYHSLPRVDFIKMDIEGAEQAALRGAEATIRSFCPKLAISVYHSLEDLWQIPAWIHELDLGYKFYLEHYTPWSHETVLYGMPDK